jgi:hypothetical protein
VFSGMPTHLKGEASAGFGFRLGAPRSPNYLVLRVMNDRFLWNRKSEEPLQFTSQPRRFQAEGHVEQGPWRAHGFMEYGTSYRAEEPATSTAPSRVTEGFQRFADLSAEYRTEGWALGARATRATRRRFQAEDTGIAFGLERSYTRFLLYGRKEMRGWTGYALAGFSSQRDAFFAPSVPKGSYRMDTSLFGVEGGRRYGERLELRLGYLGSVHSTKREVGGMGPLPDRNEHGYVDKAHIRALYTFGPSVSIELLLSQTVGGSRFGGGSIKARMVF